MDEDETVDFRLMKLRELLCVKRSTENEEWWGEGISDDIFMSWVLYAAFCV